MNSLQVHVLDHPLIQHKLTHMRMSDTPSGEFRRLLKEIGMLLAYEVTRDLPITHREILTPLRPMTAPVIDGKKVVLVSILRAGNGILDGMLELIPSARVGHIGLYREPVSLTPVEYYFKIPPNTNERDVIIVDPMLATGNSGAAAISRVKEASPLSIKFACLLASPEGIEVLGNEHPDVPIYVASIDESLDEHGYILPGLGDAGDRIYGTK